MWNVNKINNYNHWSDRWMNANDIMRFISDNNLLHIHSDLWTILSCSSEVNICFLNYFKVLKERWENFDEKVVITSILKRPEYNNEKDLVKFLNSLIKLASKRDKDWKYFIPPKYVKILADFKNLPNIWVSLQKKQKIKKLIDAIENWWLPSKAFEDFSGWATSCILDCSEINPLILNDIQSMEKAKLVSDKLDFSKWLSYFIPEYNSQYEFNYKNQFRKLKPGSLFRFKNALNSANNGKVFIVSSDSSWYHWPLNVDWETLLRALWPVWRYYIKQNQSGTCYQLAWYISMMQDPHFYYRILSRLDKIGNDLIVSLPAHYMKNNFLTWKTSEFTNNKQLFVKFDCNWKFNSIDKDQTVVAKPFYQALEHLYWKYRKYYYADLYLRKLNLSGKKFNDELNNVIKNIDYYVFDNNNGKWMTLDVAWKKRWKKYLSVEDFYKESWTSFEIFNMIWGWSSYWDILQDSDVTYSNVKKLLLNTQHGYWRVFWTKKSSKKSADWKVEIKILPEKWLYSSHAYSIYWYDPNTDMVKYINPRNSAFVFEMKLSELVKYLSEVSTKKIV